ncbi:putative Splicing factor U2AF-associated protein, partial [Melia azedarach]
ADENLRSELEADVEEECVKIGPVDSVKLTTFFFYFVCCFFYSMKGHVLISFLTCIFLRRATRVVVIVVNGLRESSTGRGFSKFKDRKDAQKCIELMNGRWFGGRQIHATEDNGLVNHTTVRDLDEDAARLEQFGAELEAE